MPDGDSANSRRIAVSPGTYRVRAYAAGSETVDEYMQEGDDHYRMVLWPAPYAAPALPHNAISHPW